MPDHIQKQIERQELANSLETQGVSLARPWRGMRTALGKSAILRFIAGEVLVAAPTVLVVLLAVLQARPIALIWVPIVGLTWLARSGRISCLGATASLVAPFMIAALLTSFDRSAVTALGGFCVTWTWWTGVEIRRFQVDAIVDRLVNNPELYALLRDNGSLEGPERANVHVAVHRSDQIGSV